MDNPTIILRIVLSIILCGLIGLERKHYHKPAGFRTNVLVGLGSTIISLVALNIFYDFNINGGADIGRIVGQIVTGIGFLGAGAIIQGRGSVHGLTTAASIWVVAAIGMAVGLGYYFLAISATVGSLIVLVILGRIEHRFEKKVVATPEDASDNK
ncbi:MAG: MgtC/SapB family protein [Patescibacteria group bacterium]|jgi:putative Mg2+ transporter-C (MgtC) family protein